MGLHLAMIVMDYEYFRLCYKNKTALLSLEVDVAHYVLSYQERFI